jgi:predicted alpha/beta superfamily hydrolase
MKTILFCIGLCSTFLLSAQETETPKFKIDYTIQSDAFGDERKITVYLPPSYYENPDEKFSTTYILDGHFNPFIEMGAKILEYNSYMYKYTPTIVVGIHAKQRGWEFSDPAIDEEGEEISYKGGRAPELQQHLKNEVFPLIDSIYTKSLPFKSLIGHSSGGEFVLYTLFGKGKDLFDAYIAINPALYPGENNTLENATAMLASGEKFPKFLYCSTGTVGDREEIFGKGLTQLDSVLNLYDHHLIWRRSTFEGMGHWTCVAPSFNASMVELTRAFRADEFLFTQFAKNKGLSMSEQLDTFYVSKQKIYGFAEIPLADYIANIGREFSGKEEFDRAIEIYDWGIKQYPNNLTLHKRKGFTLTRMNKNKEANAVFKKGLIILESLKAKLTDEQYQDELTYLEKKIKATEE